MLPGTFGRVPPRAVRRRSQPYPEVIPSDGESTFAERTEIEAPDARILWRADLDPGTLRVRASPADGRHPDAVDVTRLAPWLTILSGTDGEHVVLSDGWHHIRIDIEQGSLGDGQAVILEYVLAGVPSAEQKILPLRRLLDLYRRGRFSPSLWAADRRVTRWILVLRVLDAIAAGASQREIARVLFGDIEAGGGDGRRSDSLRSRVRRLVAEARRLASGDYRWLMRERH